MVVLFIALHQMEDDFNFPVTGNIYSDHKNNMNNVCLLGFLNCEVTVFPLAICKTFVGRAYVIITSVSKLSLYLSTYLTVDSWFPFYSKVTILSICIYLNATLSLQWMLLFLFLDSDLDCLAVRTLSSYHLGTQHPLWIPFSFSLGSDALHYTDPSHGCPLYYVMTSDIHNFQT